VAADRATFSGVAAFFWIQSKRHASRSRLYELARLLVRLDHVARFIVNANHGIV
jgi:hypothetical protein